MDSTAILILSALAAMIIVGLARWAWKLFRQLDRQQQRQAQPKTADIKAQQQARNSIVVLARGALNGQVDLTEASIRISMLLEYLKVESGARQQYAQIFSLTEATAHIPRLGEWQKLSSAERRAYRKEKEALEKRNPEEMRNALQHLVARFA
jgi:hypothetical protein